MLNLLSLNIGVVLTNIAPIIIIILFALFGYKTGFAKSFLKTFGTILAIIFSLLLCAKCAEFLQKNFGFVETVTNWFDGTLTNIFGKEFMEGTLLQATEKKLADAGIANWIIEIIISAKNNESALLQGATIGDIICPAFGYYIVMIISAIGLFIIFKAIFFLIGNTINSLHTLKPVKIIDGSLGLLLGIIKAITFVQVFILILGAIPLEFCNDILIYVNASPILSLINNINIFKVILSTLDNVNVVNIVSGLINK